AYFKCWEKTDARMIGESGQLDSVNVSRSQTYGHRRGKLARSRRAFVEDCTQPFGTGETNIEQSGRALCRWVRKSSVQTRRRRTGNRMLPKSSHWQQSE